MKHIEPETKAIPPSEPPVKAVPEKIPEKSAAPPKIPKSAEVKEKPSKHELRTAKQEKQQVIKEELQKAPARVLKLEAPAEKKQPPKIMQEEVITQEKKEAASEKPLTKPGEVVGSTQPEISVAVPEIPAPVKKEELVKPEVILSPEIRKNRIAVLPFDNFTDTRSAPARIMPAIISHLKTKGLKIIDEKKTERFFCRERIRHITYVSGSEAQRAGKLLQIGFIMAGSVFSYSKKDNPMVGISARLINADSGRIVWADYASETGENFRKLFGIGKINDIDILIPKVVERLFKSFTTSGGHTESEETYRIAVLPFKNISHYDDAGMIVTHLFLTELFKNRLFDPVEYGDVWQKMVDAKVRSRGELTYKNIQDLSDALGISTILVGTVDNYDPGIEGAVPPQVSISARLIDARNNRILWFKSLRLTGDDRIIAFDFGKMRSADRVAYAAVNELIGDLQKIK